MTKRARIQWLVTVRPQPQAQRPPQGIMDPISTPFCNTLIYTQLYHLVGPQTFETTKQGRRKGVAGGTSAVPPFPSLDGVLPLQGVIKVV